MGHFTSGILYFTTSQGIKMLLFVLNIAVLVVVVADRIRAGNSWADDVYVNEACSSGSACNTYNCVRWNFIVKSWQASTQF